MSTLLVKSISFSLLIVSWFELSSDSNESAKNKARQIITEKAHLNPAYYEKMKERLENLINEEKEERKEDADYLTVTKKFWKNY